MKRDMELIRKILLQIEKAPYQHTNDTVNLEIEESTNDKINYHVLLLAEAELIEAISFSGDDRVICFPTRLTWKGHEFLDLSRNEKIWNKVKSFLGEKGIGLSLVIVEKALEKLTEGFLHGLLP
ncbi:MAG: hypothetical protein DRP09_19445 [Candidatus Thorarchaeota archaeon]|nr:MAG: hypothetical protein DRP09_19445 [Candidatus Thorarchaeota archaeon]